MSLLKEGIKLSIYKYIFIIYQIISVQIIIE